MLCGGRVFELARANKTLKIVIRFDPVNSSRGILFSHESGERVPTTYFAHGETLGQVCEMVLIPPPQVTME